MDSFHGVFSIQQSTPVHHLHNSTIAWYFLSGMVVSQDESDDIVDENDPDDDLDNDADDLDDVDVGDVSEHLEAEDLDTKDTEEDKEVTQVKTILFICHTLQLMWKMDEQCNIPLVFRSVVSFLLSTE